MTKIKNYNAALKAIRPYINLDIDLRKRLSPSQKRQITIKFNQLFGQEGALNVPHVIYRPRTKANFKTAKRLSGVNVSGLKVVPIPAPAGAKVSVDGGKLKIRLGGVTRFIEGINKGNLVVDPQAEMQRVIGELKRRHAKLFKIQTGSYELTMTGDETATIRRGMELVNKYQAGQTVNKKGRQTYITEKQSAENWFNGIAGFIYDEQENVADYIRTMAAQKATEKKARRNMRRKVNTTKHK